MENQRGVASALRVILVGDRLTLAFEGAPRREDLLRKVVRGVGARVGRCGTVLDPPNDLLQPLQNFCLAGSAFPQRGQLSVLAKGAAGGRHELYERNWNYDGNHENIRVEACLASDVEGLTESLARDCMKNHDLDGWLADDLVNPRDLRKILDASHARE